MAGCPSRRASPRTDYRFGYTKAPAKAGANVSIILGHFQKCLTERIFFVLFANLFVIICMPYGDYGQENLFCHHIPFSGRFTMWMRVFQAVSLSYTLANRRLVSCLTLYTLFQVLHGLHEGIGIPFCTLIPFPIASRLFPRVQQVPLASYTLVWRNLFTI